jgi:indole-3-glycerol phosphate synthase
MSDFLEQMAASSRERLDAARRGCSEALLLQRAHAMPPAPGLMTDPAHFDLIAELKLRSPAVGQLKSGDEDVEGRVTAYARAGAAAVSVLTEPSGFDGSMAHLETATKALAPLNVPAMRKDFLIDPYQVIEARVAGAGGVLVIIRLLSRSGIEEMLECARNLGLFVLLEAFDEADIEVMQDILGVAAATGRPTRRRPWRLGPNSRYSNSGRPGSNCLNNRRRPGRCWRYSSRFTSPRPSPRRPELPRPGHPPDRSAAIDRVGSSIAQPRSASCGKRRRITTGCRSRGGSGLRARTRWQCTHARWRSAGLGGSHAEGRAPKRSPPQLSAIQ